MANVKPIPDGYHAITPYLIIDGAARAIEFYKAAFGATERFRFPTPNGKIGHAELQIGDSVIMLADESPEQGARSPGRVGGSPVTLMLYVTNVDTTVDRAVTQGAVVKRALADQFYGDRTATLEDPFGHQWHVATHIEDVPMAELESRAKAAHSG
ncbi:MAG: VOC family protein [Aliidongia sp.]|jgi:PhnB protein